MWIGGHVIILSGVTIGSHSVIGAGSVAKDIPEWAVVAGNPATVKKYRNRSDASETGMGGENFECTV